MSTKNSWKSYGGIYKTQEVTNLGIGTLVVDEIITRKKVLETLVFEQILTLENDFIQEIGNVNTYGISKFDRSTYHNADVYIKNNVQLIDDRGEFFKFLDGNESFLSNTFGEIYLVTVLPKKIRAEHYHNIANEWFAVLKGELIITLEDVTSKVKISYTLKVQINFFLPTPIDH